MTVLFVPDGKAKLCAPEVLACGARARARARAFAESASFFSPINQLFISIAGNALVLAFVRSFVRSFTRPFVRSVRSLYP